LSHHEVLSRLDGYDAERGVKVVGHRGYFLKNYGVFLNQALINYGLEFLSSKGYTALQTPQFMLKDYMAKTAQLEQFDEELYKVVDGDEQNDKYLIATSEQPISAFHADEWLLDKNLPIRYGETLNMLDAGAILIELNLLGMPVLVHAIDGKRDRMVRMPGVFFAFISSKR
jgi:seryl-tRNA synthetase